MHKITPPLFERLLPATAQRGVQRTPQLPGVVFFSVKEANDVSYGDVLGAYANVLNSISGSDISLLDNGEMDT